MSDASPPLADPTPIGESPAFLDMLAHVSQVAPLNRPLLLCGERGVGKEVIANRLVYLSNRWDKPLLKLNCAALAESLLDSELFGHEAGAFTGATRRRASRFEMADGGTPVPRRDRQCLARGAGEDFAGDRIWKLRARRRQCGAPGRCADHCRDQCRSPGAGRGGKIPPRSAGPARLRRDPDPALARAPGGHPSARHAFRDAR